MLFTEYIAVLSCGNSIENPFSVYIILINLTLITMKPLEQFSGIHLVIRKNDFSIHSGLETTGP